MNKIQQQQIEIVKYRKEPKPTLGYIILNALFSTIIFVFVYFAYILPRERDILTFALLFALNCFSGIVGSAIARIFTANYSNLTKTAQEVNRGLISALIYSVIVFWGLFNFVMARYIDLNTTTVAQFLIYVISRDFLEIVALLMGMKVVVFLFSEFLSNKLVIG
jgi:Na+/H+-translocating membrane pyrophosphatase